MVIQDFSDEEGQPVLRPIFLSKRMPYALTPPKSATAFKNRWKTFSIRIHEIEHLVRVLYKRLCDLKHEHL